MSAFFLLTGDRAEASQPTADAVWFTPGLDTQDAYTSYWVRQAVLRLRRELCWAWRQTQTPDPLTDALHRSRLHEQRLHFFERDEYRSSSQRSYRSTAADSPRCWCPWKL